MYMLSSKLASTWVSSVYNEKRIIQKMIFPKGLSYHRENDEYLTTRPNRVFQLIAQLTDDPEKNKSRISSFFLAISGSVHEHTEISNQFLEDLVLIDELRPFIEPKEMPE